MDLLSLAQPERPNSLRTLDLGSPDSSATNSVAFHPQQDMLAAAVAAASGETGEIHILDMYGKILTRYPAGYGPDDIHFSPAGDWLAVANEADGYWVENGQWWSHPGSVTLIDLRRPDVPIVQGLLPLRRANDTKLAPEGIVIFEQDGARYVAVDNEKSGTVSIVAIEL